MLALYYVVHEHIQRLWLEILPGLLVTVRRNFHPKVEGIEPEDTVEPTKHSLEPLDADIALVVEFAKVVRSRTEGRVVHPYTFVIA